MTYTLTKVLVFLALYNAAADGVSVIADPVNVMETGLFLQYMTGIDHDVVLCTALFTQNGANITFYLDPNSVQVSKPDNFEDNNNLYGRLSSLGRGLCGFKASNWSSVDPDKWFLVALDSEDNLYEESFAVSVYEYYPDEQYIYVKVKVGSKHTISCGPQSPVSQEFCKFFDTTGELVMTSRYCNYHKLITMIDIGTWHCTTGAVHSMGMVIFVVELIPENREHSTGWITEANDYYSIGCRIEGYISAPRDYCTMVSPSGEEYIIHHGGTTERYTTVKTNITDSTCGIEIAKPLQTTELGLWKCKFGDYGRILNLGGVEVPDYQRKFKISVDLTPILNFKCTVPYSAVYCHIIAPDSKRYPSTIPTMSELGECSYSGEFATGTWVCAFARETDSVFEKIEIEVQVTDVLVNSEILKARDGESLEISCKFQADFGMPVKYCWFLSPTNVSYYLHENLDSDEMTYIGKGFDYGDCSIRINAIISEYYGNWTCIAVDYDNVESTVSINISARSYLTATTSAILISFAVIFVVLVITIVIVIIYKWKKRQIANGNEPETVVFDRTARRNSDQPLATIRPINYNTTDQFDLRLRR